MSSQSATLRIEINGEFTIFTAAGVRQQLLDALAHGDEVEVDLSAVSEMDSAGVQLMVAAKSEAAARSKILRFSGHSRAVFDVLDLCDIVGHLGDPLLIHSETK